MKTLQPKLQSHTFVTRITSRWTFNLCLTFFLVFHLGINANAATGVKISTNAPLYGFSPLSGEVLCMNVQITGGTLNTVNWSVPGGGAVFLPSSGGTVASVTAGLPMQCIQITAAPGTLSVTGTSGSNGLTSTSVVKVHAQSVDDPTQSVDTPFYVAANTTRVRIVGAFYQQVFLTQDSTITADVQGNADQSGKWNITASPTGSSPTLSDADKRTVTLHAATPGRYTLTFTSNADSSKTGTAIVYMAATASPFVLSPSKYIASQNKTKIVPCEVDPAFTTVYDIGPGQKYPDFVSTPSADTVAPGTIYRFHNTDTTGGAPTTVHNYFQVANSGTPTQPIYVCGVPDTYGNLPILDGNDAVGQAGVHQYGGCYQYALLCFDAGGYSRGHATGPYQAEPIGPNYVAAAGIHLRNTRGNLYPPGQTSGGETPWGSSAACVAIQSGTQIDLAGLDLENCANGLYTTENENNGFAATTLGVSLRNSHIHLFGNTGSSLEHAIYFQTFFGIIEGTLIDEPLTAGNVGGCIKWRGVDGIFRYNSCPAGVGRDFDGVEVQDDGAYVDLARYIDNGNYAAGDATPDIIAGLQATLYNGDWFYGNLIKQASGEALHYRADHDGLMGERLGQFYVYNNTIDQALIVFGINDAQNGGSHYLDPVMHAFNNIFDNAGVTILSHSFGVSNHLTNLYRTGSVYAPGPPIPVTSWYITPGGQLVVNGANTLVNDYASGVTFSGLSGASGACLNGTVFPVQYAGPGNFQGPTTCAPTGSDSAPNVESSAVATPRILGGSPNGGTAHGWSGSCYYACPWMLTVPIDSHQYGLSAANFRFTPTQPYDPTTFVATSAAYNAGSALPPAAAQLPVRYQFNPLTNAVEPRTQPLTIGARDAGSFSAALAPSLTSVTVTPAAVKLAVADTQQLTATCTYSDATSTNCTSTASWSNGGSSAFTVSASGLITAKAAGTGSVTASYGAASGTSSITVAPPTLTSISLSPATVKLLPAATQQLTATCTYSDSSTTNCSGTVQWSTSNASLFGVSASGLITATSTPGTGSAIATLSGVTGSAAVTVTPPPATLTGVSIAPAQVNLTVGSAQQLTATCAYSDYTTSNCSSTVAWSTGVYHAFTISTTGLATGVNRGVGFVAVTAQVNSSTVLTATASVMVSRTATPTLSKITLTPAAVSATRSSNVQLGASCSYSDGSTTNCTSTVAWSSSSQTVFAISTAGLLHGSIAGSGTATAKLNGVTATSPVVISQPTLTSVSITPAYVGVVRANSQQLTATCAYADSTSEDCSSSVTWSNSGATSFSITPTGLLTGNLVGSGTITATSGSVVGTAHALVLRTTR